MLSDLAAALSGNTDFDTALDRITLTNYVQKAIHCQLSGALLDKRRAVAVQELDAKDEVLSARVVTATVWDEQVAPNIPADTTIRYAVLDGRTLF